MNLHKNLLFKHNKWRFLLEECKLEFPSKVSFQFYYRQLKLASVWVSLRLQELSTRSIQLNSNIVNAALKYQSYALTMASDVMAIVQEVCSITWFLKCPQLNSNFFKSAAFSSTFESFPMAWFSVSSLLNLLR